MPNQDNFLTDKIEPSWKDALAAEFNKPYFTALTKFVREEYLSGGTIYPAEEHIFAAFELCPINSVKAVIIGQDPYPGPNQAHGLCFSVKNNDLPDSLQNIYREIADDLGQPSKTKGDLTSWATQGVLLLNSILTIKANKRESHSDKAWEKSGMGKFGWEEFTGAAIRALSGGKKNLVYMLWGKFAQERERAVVNPEDNLILKAAHPSPLSAHKGFFGCRHFSRANEYLREQGKTPVEW
jgi:uracil-DNA glycosylase